jgi:hypothetical protein
MGSCTSCHKEGQKYLSHPTPTPNFTISEIIPPDEVGMKVEVVEKRLHKNFDLRIDIKANRCAEPIQKQEETDLP